MILFVVCQFHGLFQWRDLLDKATFGEDVHFIDLLNATVVDGWFFLKRSNARVNNLIRKKAQTVRAMHKKTPGRKRNELDNKVYSLSVGRGELESIQALKSRAIRINKELEEWRKSYTDLKKEKKRNYMTEMRQQMSKLEENVTDLSEVKKELLDYNNLRPLRPKRQQKHALGTKVHKWGQSKGTENLAS